MPTEIVHPNTCACCGDLLHARIDRRRLLHVAAGAGMLAAFPSIAFAAEGNYEAMLLNCIDPRFPEPTIKIHGRPTHGWPIQPILDRGRVHRRGGARVQKLGAGVLGQSCRIDPAASHSEGDRK